MAGQTLAENDAPLRIITPLEARHEIVAVTDQDGFAPHPRLDFGLEPRIQCVMQIDVPKNRGKHRPACLQTYRKARYRSAGLSFDRAGFPPAGRPH